jgi:hypothetical protein
MQMGFVGKSRSSQLTMTGMAEDGREVGCDGFGMGVVKAAGSQCHGFRAQTSGKQHLDKPANFQNNEIELSGCLSRRGRNRPPIHHGQPNRNGHDRLSRRRPL